MLKHWLLILSAACSFNIYAAVLHTPYTVELLVINGQKVDTQKHDYSLNSGHNQIVMKYAKTLRNGSKNEKFESKPLVTDINVTADTNDYYIKHHHFNSFSEAASAFNNNKFGWTITANGTTTELTTEILPGSPGFLPYHDIEKLVSQYNQQHHITDSTSASLPADSQVVDNFKNWYMSASPDAKKAMLKWMIDHSSN